MRPVRPPRVCRESAALVLVLLCALAAWIPMPVARSYLDRQDEEAERARALEFVRETDRLRALDRRREQIRLREQSRQREAEERRRHAAPPNGGNRRPRHGPVDFPLNLKRAGPLV
jgi:hypothetical protein